MIWTKELFFNKNSLGCTGKRLHDGNNSSHRKNYKEIDIESHLTGKKKPVRMAGTQN